METPPELDRAPTVTQLLVCVMRDIDVISKDDRNTQQGYRFRGVDATMNTVGPILRRHGLVCIPRQMTLLVDRDVTTQRNNTMRSVTVQVDWQFIGPEGDVLEVQTLGESADTSDKAIPKATSVAYRELWLKTLCVPTEEPDVDQDPAPSRGAEPAKNSDPNPEVKGQLLTRIQRLRSESGAQSAWQAIVQAATEGVVTAEEASVLREALGAKVNLIRQAVAGAGLDPENAPGPADEVGDYS